jgi:hypothetical protein
MSKTFILLTGRKGSGKDTWASIANELHPDRVAALAVADWFKVLLSNVTKQPVQAFYDERKEASYATPLVMDRRLQIRLGLELTTTLSRFGVAHEHAVIYKNLELHKGKVFKSNRELMIWFGQYINQVFGSDDVHCKILLRAIDKLPPGKDLVIVTDARTHHESSHLKETAKERGYGCVTVKVINKHAKQSDAAIEQAADQFPDNYFDHILENPYPDYEAYKQLVATVLNTLV